MRAWHAGSSTDLVVFSCTSFTFESSIPNFTGTGERRARLPIPLSPVGVTLCLYPPLRLQLSCRLYCPIGLTAGNALQGSAIYGTPISVASPLLQLPTRVSTYRWYRFEIGQPRNASASGCEKERDTLAGQEIEHDTHCLSCGQPERTGADSRDLRVMSLATRTNSFREKVLSRV